MVQAGNMNLAILIVGPQLVSPGSVELYCTNTEVGVSASTVISVFHVVDVHLAYAQPCY